MAIVKRPRSLSEDNRPEPTGKKLREDAAVLIHPETDDFVHSARSLRTAFDLKKAIWGVKGNISSIGYSIAKFRGQISLEPKIQRAQRKLDILHDECSTTYKSGKYTGKYRFQITRPGCEFDGLISQDQQERDVCLAIIPELYKHADTAPFGDIHALETRVDPEVRDAREIPADQFIVDPKLLDAIRTTWACDFIPDDVRVEPYKIHLYGPGGHFKSHRDTPEPGLVGTFLVGLGDTISPEQKANGGMFHIKSISRFAETCSYVAFYPDIPHHISKLAESQYRAVIAFKIFKAECDIPQHEAPWEFYQEELVQPVLAKIPVPYGLLLGHKYHMGASQLTGLDAVIFSAARKRSGVQVHVLPVIISTSAYYTCIDGEEDEFETSVYPFTSAHVDYILKRGQDPSSTTMPWLRELDDIPFYSMMGFDASAKEWHQDRDETNYIGNESDATRETSLYVSFAMVCLSDGSLGSGPSDADESGSGEDESLSGDESHDE